ncbi:MAG: HEPN domain-containing protein [Candidatus Poribacteria bacterium]|nr:HEPN domain-containing protein [Candidatus Poribacteria bacterium]
MKLETKQELEQLLHEAIVHLKINNAEFVEPITVETYKENLQSLRKHYRPDLASQMSFYHLDIQNEVIKSKLLDFINVHLKDYINKEENLIQPASYGIGNGGSLSGQPVEMLLTKLLQIALASKVKRALEAFEKTVSETKGSFKRIILLQGPTTKIQDIHKLTEIQICEGIRFVCLPNVPQKLPPYLFAGGFSSLMLRSHPGIFSLKTIIVIDCEVSPLFIAPKFGDPTVNSDGSKSISPVKDAYPFQIKIKSTEYPDFDVDIFCQAISLTCNFPCESILTWGYIDTDEIYSVRGTGLVPTARCVLPNEPVSSNGISETQIPQIKRLYENLAKLNKDTREKLQIPIDRWIKSKTSQTAVDKIIDLGIAFEALYLSETDYNREIRFRFSLHAAWHLGKDKAHREELMKEFKTIYDWRSKVVHTGKLSKKAENVAQEFITNAQNLCRDSILKILEDGKFPDWNDLILGEESS